MIQYPWVGGGLGWFYYLYHKNINKTLIFQIFYDDFCEELQTGDSFLKNGWGYSKLCVKFPTLQIHDKSHQDIWNRDTLRRALFGALG
jgi:hypothetical protein